MNCHASRWDATWQLSAVCSGCELSLRDTHRLFPRRQACYVLRGVDRLREPTRRTCTSCFHVLLTKCSMEVQLCEMHRDRRPACLGASAVSETRKLAAILVADIVGYSRLAGADEDRILARLRTLRSDLIDPILAVHHGRVVKRTGDGAIIEFRSVVDAVRCAIEVQSGLAV